MGRELLAVLCLTKYIDTDFPGLRRQEVKRYMEQRYGENRVCSVGTYSTLKIKALLKDLGRIYNVSIATMNYITKLIEDDWTYEDLFKNSLVKPALKKFIQENAEMVSKIPLMLNQPRSKSIHACATIITPQTTTCAKSFPVREDSGELISEYEGGELEDIGFLKEDILGIKQLDKFQSILDTIKERTGESIDIYNLPLDDREVYRYFRNGWNGDVFHFGSKGLTEYCKELKPENLEDLIAAISLYRPGAMENNFHKEYVQRKHGEKEVEYLTGTENITDKTYGLFTYQEQILKIVQQLANFDEETSDAVRKSMGKKKLDVIQALKKQFIDGSTANGFDKNDMESLWDKMEKSSGYLFNRSHAAAYTLTGYVSQWLKVHYPKEYWLTALKNAPEDKIPAYISEIYKTGNINIIGVDVNISEKDLVVSENTITFALSSVKGISDAAVEPILEERQKGEYLSFEDFYQRLSYKGSKVNKTAYERLILCGAFDKTDMITKPKERISLIHKYREMSKVKIDKKKDWFENNSVNWNKNWWWLLQQKRMSGIAFFNFESMIANNGFTDFADVHLLQDKKYSDNRQRVSVGGYILSVETREIKKGEMATILLDSNYDFLFITCFPEQWEVFKPILEEAEKDILIIDGEIGYDKFKKQNVLYLDNETQIKTLK